jgi:hypothetical protein
MLIKEKESHNSHVSMAMGKSRATFKGFVSSEVLIFSSTYSTLISTIESWREGGIGTLFGGIYLRISTDIATMVNAKRVPTLTCRRKAKHIFVENLFTYDSQRAFQNKACIFVE